MSETTKTITLICGSPKARKDHTLSEYFTDLEQQHIAREGIAVHRVNARTSILHDNCEAAFHKMLSSDVLIFTFPLYFFCLPGLLMRFLQDYVAYAKQHIDENKPKKIYAVINCGFPEPEINEEAGRVVKSFSKSVGAEYRFSLLIGGGGMLPGTKEAPFMHSTMDSITAVFDQMHDDILSNSTTAPQDVLIEMHFPKKLYFLMGNLGWRSTARREHKLRASELKRHPYRD